MAGDAAGVIDPFSGEGQAAALASGILAAETVERQLSGELSREECARAYAREWRGASPGGSRGAPRSGGSCLNRGVGAVAGRLAGERIVRFAISATR